MTQKKGARPGREASLAVSFIVRDQLNALAREWMLSQSDTVAGLLTILPLLKQAGIKVRHIPAFTELEFPPPPPTWEQKEESR